MTDTGTTAADPRAELLAGYDHALPHVYGYLLNRCGSADLAEDLTAETFLAAASAVRGPSPPAPDVAWLIGVARHKLADHWRRRWRDERNVRAVASDPTVGPETEDPWDGALDALRARETLAQLAPHHRAALTLRYVDDLPVPAGRRRPRPHRARHRGPTRPGPARVPHRLHRRRGGRP